MNDGDELLIRIKVDSFVSLVRIARRDSHLCDQTTVRKAQFYVRLTNSVVPEPEGLSPHSQHPATGP
jgi:hypothetical protein